MQAARNLATYETLCEGRALTVAKAALPSHTPPGHAKQATVWGDDLMTWEEANHLEVYRICGIG